MATTNQTQLDAIRDLLSEASDVHEVREATLLLVSWCERQYPPAGEPSDVGQVTLLLQLVRDASRLLNVASKYGGDEPELGWADDVTDWQRSAKPFVEGQT